jgi:hypothetical protein
MHVRIHSDINLTDINQCPPTPQSASVSLETVKDSCSLNIDALESTFIPDLAPSSHTDEYQQLISWFYDQTIAYGWRKAPPPVAHQMRQNGILLDYERQGYKPWAIRNMVEWHVKRQHARGHPMVSFEFFDASKSQYNNPMQEALEAVWRERQHEDRLDDSECDIEGLKRLREMFIEIFSPKASDEYQTRNNQFCAALRMQREEQNTRIAILKRLDLPDKTIPAVEDLQPSQYQDAAG